MGYTESYESIVPEHFYANDNEYMYNLIMGKLEEITQGITSKAEQKGGCNKALCVYLAEMSQNIYGYSRHIYNYGFAISFDNKDTSIVINKNQQIKLIGNNVLRNFHFRVVTVDDYYKRLKIMDYVYDTATFQKGQMEHYLIDPDNTYMGSWKIAWWSFSNLGGDNGFDKNDEYHSSYRNYMIKSYKKHYGGTLSPYYQPSDDDMLKYAQTYIDSKATLNFRRSYMSIIPVVDNATDDFANKIVGGGDWTDVTVETPPKPATDFKVYLDGTKLPNIKIVWHNTDIEDKHKVDNTRVIVQYANTYTDEHMTVDDAREGYAEIKTTEEIPYSDGNYKISFSDFYEKTGHPPYDEGIGQILPKNSGWLILSINYYDDITQVLPTFASTKMCARILPNGDLVGYYGAWSDNDGSTIKVVANGIDLDTGDSVPDGDEDDGYNDPSDSEDADLADGQNNSIGVLTTTYNMTKERLNQLGSFLWSANIFDEFSLINSNPIENIVSCKNIPMQLDGVDEIIKLGNVDTGVNGAKISHNFGDIVIGSFTVPHKYNNFLDLAPYTKITLYLPYIGFKELDSTIVMGKQITIKYVIDVLTGGCLAQVYVNNTRMYEFSGQVGVDIPITASNRAQVEAGYISGAISDGASLAVGDIGGVAKSIISSAMSKYHYSSTDRPNASCVASVNRTCYLIIDRPTYQDLKAFNHTQGRMCNLTKKIGSLRGFTICDSNIELSGINATEDEKKEIINILSIGFFA